MNKTIEEHTMNELEEKLNIELDKIKDDSNKMNTKDLDITWTSLNRVYRSYKRCRELIRNIKESK